MSRQSYFPPGPAAAAAGSARAAAAMAARARAGKGPHSDEQDPAGRPPRPAGPSGDGDGRGGCEWAPRHLPVVVYARRRRWRFRRRFLVRCWACELELGPFETWAMANAERQELESADA